MTNVGVSSSKEAGHKVDFAIITALEIEAKAVVRRLQNHTVKRFEDQDIRTYHCGTVSIPVTDQTYHVVVVTLPGKGTISAANAVTDAIARWNPRYVLMVGIAGGIPQDDMDLGDVIVADQVVGYDYGKVTPQGIQPRDRVYPVSALLLDRIRNFWDSAWAQYVYVARPANARRAAPKRFVGPIASGDKVIASAEFREQLTQHWPKLLAVEMEAEGVFAAVFDRPDIRHALVIRGISDMADERKSDEWQEYAANAAAAFVEGFLKSGPVEPQTGGPDGLTDTLSGELYKRLRQALLDCGPFESDRTLRAVFAHPALKPLQSGLPQASSTADRVDEMINFLSNVRNSSGESMLVVLLRVLSERINPAIDCHHRLAGLANELARASIRQGY
jgi:nucleoside phosphorylase